jgi:hypothetical protein
MQRSEHYKAEGPGERSKNEASEIMRWDMVFGINEGKRYVFIDPGFEWRSYYHCRLSA